MCLRCREHISRPVPVYVPWHLKHSLYEVEILAGSRTPKTKYHKIYWLNNFLSPKYFCCYWKGPIQTSKHRTSFYFHPFGIRNRYFCDCIKHTHLYKNGTQKKNTVKQLTRGKGFFFSFLSPPPPNCTARIHFTVPLKICLYLTVYIV